MKYIMVLLLALLAAAFWYTKERLRLSPHASYHAALVHENLDASARRWQAEAETSLANPLLVTLPFSERRLLEAAYLQPVTLAFERQTDQLIQVDIFPSRNTRAEIFVDVFFLEEGEAPTRLTSMAVNEQQVTVTAGQSGRYLVRVQPAHSALGLIDLAVTSPLRYGFPVDTERENAVQSFFGAGRDAGTRRHEGVDIFAARGTPVTAAAEGRVSRVGETPRGGKHVWVQGDQRSFYYAHLDSIAVTPGDKVARGQVLGTVGNTGNAITTSPHLHFGIYKRLRGAIDPLPLIGKTRIATAFTPPEVELAPRWVAVNAERANLRAGPSLQSATADSLNRGELVRVDAVAGDWLRISAGTGAQGFIARRLTETASESNLHLSDRHVVVSAPQKDAPVIGEFAAGRQLPALGRFGDFTLVKMPGGFYGWARPELARPGLAR